jgi:hypothetical protein
MKKIFPLLSLLFVLASCEKEADIALPEIQPKLSVSCFISPEQDFTMAYVRWSRPVFSSDNTERPVDDLEVTLSNGSTTAQFQFIPELYQYQLSADAFPIEPGVEYTLRVKSPLGDEVIARTSVPVNLPEIESATLDSSSFTDNYGEPTIQFNYKTTLVDNSPEFQYYRFIYYNVSNWLPDEESAYQEGQSFRDDGDITNGKIYAEERVTYYGYPGQMLQKKLAVVACSESYYRYHRSIQNQTFDNPFAEPTIVYSNIEGGLGVFGGFQAVMLEY